MPPLYAANMRISTTSVEKVIIKEEHKTEGFFLARRVENMSDNEKQSDNVTEGNQVGVRVFFRKRLMCFSFFIIYRAKMVQFQRRK